MDITVYHKTDQIFSFHYYESDNTTSRSLVGATVYFTVKKNPSDTSVTDATALISKDVTSHTSPAGGLTDIILTSSQTNVPQGKYFYDIKVKEADNKVYLAQSGRITIIGTPTNRA